MTEFMRIIHWIFLPALQVVQTVCFLISSERTPSLPLATTAAKPTTDIGAHRHFESMNEKRDLHLLPAQSPALFHPHQQVGSREVIPHAGHKGQSILDVARREDMFPKKQVSHHPTHCGIS